MSDGQGEPVAGDVFRTVMSQFPTFVTVITTSDEDGPVGCTATAVLSLSLRPPSLLVSLHSDGRTVDRILGAGAFAVNVLSVAQWDWSRRFATGEPGARFAGVPHTVVAGVPALTGAAATVGCALTQSIRVLDHTLLVGEVRWTATGTQEPLVLLGQRPHAAEPLAELLAVA
ncbi:MAG TPA: flavin reductase family protein [Pseudonocardiaceae bacterium]